ncbi:MAG: pantoate--beta-alanine ligase [Bacteroidota bacterium]
MEILRTVAAMQQHADAQRCAGKRLALVPTMGALHEGHLSLVSRARTLADHVTVSIFVNPTQFGPNEDFDAYPRTIDADLAKLDALGGVDAVFMPGVADMYPNTQAAHKAWVSVKDLDQHLCGAYRDGHFLGVTTVVTKLFNACRPHLGVFGLKDAQQFLILRRMSHDLNMGIELVGVPTYRESDGLAASSRNVYLSDLQRSQAPALHAGLQLGKAAIEAGEQHPDAIKELVANHINTNTDGEIQYIEVVDTHDIQPVDTLTGQAEVLIALAVYFGRTRLIDNVFVSVEQN